MNACIWTAYGAPQVLQLKRIPKPVPKDNEILVKIKRTTVFYGDCEMRGLRPPLNLGFVFRLVFGFMKPKENSILGQEFSGIVESVGKEVKEFKPGDSIFGTKDFPFGTYAEYCCVTEKMNVIQKPEYISHEEAACLAIGGPESIHFLDSAGTKKDSKVLIIGAGGTIGSYAVRYARHLGAQVTGVDHTSKLQLISSIGCTEVFDYTKTKLSDLKEKYDIVYDGAAKSSTAEMESCLAPGGKIVIGTPTWGQLLQGVYDKRFVTQFASPTKAKLAHALELYRQGILKPVMDEKKFSLEEMAQAHEYGESGMKRGSIVVSVSD
jgi:NADPH:quinone reductase-like Zn-dependent oxidoreductase